MKDWREGVSFDAEICHGQPCIWGTRMRVWLIVGFPAKGDTVEGILETYPSLSRKYVLAALSYAAEMTRVGRREPGSPGQAGPGKG